MQCVSSVQGSVIPRRLTIQEPNHVREFLNRLKKNLLKIEQVWEHQRSG